MQSWALSVDTEERKLLMQILYNFQLKKWSLVAQWHGWQFSTSEIFRHTLMMSWYIQYRIISLSRVAALGDCCDLKCLVWQLVGTKTVTAGVGGLRVLDLSLHSLLHSVSRSVYMEVNICLRCIHDAHRGDCGDWSSLAWQTEFSCNYESHFLEGLYYVDILQIG